MLLLDRLFFLCAATGNAALGSPLVINPWGVLGLPFIDAILVQRITFHNTNTTYTIILFSSDVLMPPYIR